MSDLKLFRVDWSGECYVLAESHRQAETIATDWAERSACEAGLEPDAAQINGREIHGYSAVAADWEDAIPLHPVGTSVDQTCQEWVDEHYPPDNPDQMKLDIDESPGRQS